MRSDSPVIGVLVPLLIGGLVFGGGAHLYLEEGERLRTFEPTEATIVDSHVAEVRGADEDGDGLSDVSYEPSITFAYEVDGRTYESDELYAGSGGRNLGEDGAADLVAEYPVGSRVTAYYDPENPEDAYLREQRSGFPLAVAGFGAIFLLFGLVDFARNATRILPTGG